MGHEEQDVHQKSQEGDEKGRKKENEEREEVSCRVRWRVQMRSSGETETYQVEQRSYRMNDKKSREGMASG